MCFNNTSSGFQYTGSNYRVDGAVNSSITCRVSFTQTPTITLMKPAKNGRGGGMRRFRINSVVVRINEGFIENIKEVLDCIDPYTANKELQNSWKGCFRFFGNWALTSGGWSSEETEGTVEFNDLDTPTRNIIHASVGALLDEHLSKANNLYKEYSMLINVATGNVKAS